MAGADRSVSFLRLSCLALAAAYTVDAGLRNAGLGHLPLGFALVLVVACSLASLARNSTWPQSLPAQPRLGPLALVAAAVAGTSFWFHRAMLGAWYLGDDLYYVAATTADPGLLPPLAWLLGRGDGIQYVRPLAHLTTYFEVKLFAADALYPHLLNLLLHASSAALIAWIAGRLSCSRGAATIAGFLFGLSPLAVPTVGWLNAHMDSLCVFFYVAALAAFVEALADRRGAWAASLALAALALLSKEPALTLPVPIAALALGWKREARSARGLARFAAPHVALVAAYLLARFALFGGLGGYMSEGHAVAASLKPGAMSAVFLELPRVYLVAGNQAIVPAVEALRSGAAALALLLLAAALGTASGAAVALVLAGSALMAASFAPVHNMLWVGPELLNARYLYLGVVGFALAATGLVHGAFAGRSRATTSAAALYGLIALLVAVANREQWLANDSLVAGMARDLRSLDRVRGVGRVEFLDFPHTYAGSYVFNYDLVPEVALGRSLPALWRDDSGVDHVRAGALSPGIAVSYRFLGEPRLWQREEPARLTPRRSSTTGGS